MEALRIANEPPELVVLASAKSEWTVAERRVMVDIDGLIEALKPEQIGAESNKS